MKFLSLLLLGLFVACVKQPEVVEEGRSTASVNPEAPYIWSNYNGPKTLGISSNFNASEVAAITSMANAWKTAVNNKKTWFNIDPQPISNKSNNLNPDLLLDSTLGIYKTTFWPQDIPEDALAVTQIFGRRYNAGQPNEYVGIEHADIMVNYEWHSFDVNDNPLHWDSDYDFQTVILHELGHFLGLGHIDRSEDRTSSVMYPSITTREQKQVPQPRDITELADRYNINLGSSGGHALAANRTPRYVPKNNDPGKEARIILELRSNGECVHKENGVEIRRHRVKK